MFVFSSHLICLTMGCNASFDAFGASAEVASLSCAFCGGELHELAEPVTSEPETGLIVTSGPRGARRDLALESLSRVGAPLVLTQGRCAAWIRIREEDLVALAGEVEVNVEVEAFGRHKSPTVDRWVAKLPELDVKCVDTGLNAALVSLADSVSKRVRQLLDQNGPERTSNLALLLSLWYQDEAGRLGKVLEESAVLANWEYDRDAC